MFPVHNVTHVSGCTRVAMVEDSAAFEGGDIFLHRPSPITSF